MLAAWSRTLIGAIGAASILCAWLALRWWGGGPTAMESAATEPLGWALFAFLPFAAFVAGLGSAAGGTSEPRRELPRDAAALHHALAIGQFAERGLSGHGVTRWISISIAALATFALGPPLHACVAAATTAVAILLDYRLFTALLRTHRRGEWAPAARFSGEMQGIVHRIAVHSWVYSVPFVLLGVSAMPGPILGVLFGFAALLLVCSRHTLTATMAMWTMIPPVVALFVSLWSLAGGYAGTIVALGSIVAANVVVLARASHTGSEALIRAEIASRLAAEDLEQRVRERTRELDEARRQSDAANLAKSQFLANMSHELRTPLNAIIGYTEILVEGATDDGREQDVADHARVLSAARQLLGLVNEVLDLAKIESGRMEIHLGEVSVQRLVRDAVDAVRPQAEANGNRLAVELGPEVGVVETDGDLLRQCLLNLLSNAAKFTRDGEIVVRAVRVGAGLRLEVEDTGIGIPREKLDEVFRPFVQVDASSTRTVGGTGLGLTITRRAMRALGGDVSVRSVLGAGSVFRLDLPIEARAGRTEPVARGEARPALTP